MTALSEDTARRILVTAVAESRCSELLSCLFDGGSATVDTAGKLVLVSGDMIEKMWAVVDE